METPLSFRNILAGVIITVIGGIILALLIQDARFAPENRVSSGVDSAFTRYSDPSGVFDLYYPSIFIGIQKSQDQMVYSYIFGTEEKPNEKSFGYIGLFFSEIAEQGLSDNMWRSLISNYKLLPGDTYNSILIDSNLASGHSLYAEWKVTPLDRNDLVLHAITRLDESEGIKLIAVIYIDDSEWSKLKDSAILSLRSIYWSPSAARTILHGTSP